MSLSGVQETCFFWLMYCDKHKHTSPVKTIMELIYALSTNPKSSQINILNDSKPSIKLKIIIKWIISNTSCLESFAVHLCGTHFKLQIQKLTFKAISASNWALAQPNLSSGFPTKWDSNQSPQLQRHARKLKFRSKQVWIRYFSISE